ncbi:MAG: hypothetical protein WA790_14730 [Sulfitobacter sp.]
MTYQEHHIHWQGIAIVVRHCSDWAAAFLDVQHIEVVSENREALPITETGYKSHFLTGADALKEFGGCPVAYVTAWLNHAAQSKRWQGQRQLSMF